MNQDKKDGEWRVCIKLTLNLVPNHETPFWLFEQVLYRGQNYKTARDIQDQSRKKFDFNQGIGKPALITTLEGGIFKDTPMQSFETIRHISMLLYKEDTE